jgi:hypothetical protein
VICCFAIVKPVVADSLSPPVCGFVVELNNSTLPVPSSTGSRSAATFLLNKQPNNQTTKQTTNKQTNKQTKQHNKQRNKTTNKQDNNKQQTNKQTNNKQTTNNKPRAAFWSSSLSVH